MSRHAEFAELDAIVDARLSALARRARAEADADVSFTTSGEASSTEPDELWRLIALARNQDDQQFQSFTTDPPDAGQEDQALHGCSQLLQRALGTLIYGHYVETGEGASRIRTQIDWTGDMNTYLLPGVSPTDQAAHAAAMEDALAKSIRLVRLSAIILIAAGRIAALIATPGAALAALPIAYRCVRDIYDQWNTSNPDLRPRETPWQ